MDKLELAAKVFPWSRYTRTRPAYLLIAYAAPNETTVAVIEDRLRTDPFSADLTLGLAYHAYGIRDDFRANAAWAAFVQLAPNSKLAPQIREGLKGVRQ